MDNIDLDLLSQELINYKQTEVYNDKEIKVYIEGLFNDISNNINNPKGDLYDESIFHNDVENFNSGKINLGNFFAKCTTYGLMNHYLFNAVAMKLIEDYSYSKLEEMGIDFPEWFDLGTN